MTTPSRTCSRCGYTNGVLGDFNFANNRSEHLCQRFFGAYDRNERNRMEMSFLCSSLCGI